jgi:hypothetical protein
MRNLSVATLAYLLMIHLLGETEKGSTLYAAMSPNAVVALPLIGLLVLVSIIFRRGYRPNSFYKRLNLWAGLVLLLVSLSGIFNFWMGPALGHYFEILDLLALAEAGVLLSLSSVLTIRPVSRHWTLPGLNWLRQINYSLLDAWRSSSATPVRKNPHG